MNTRFAELDEILPLRQAVIIAGTGRTSPYFDGDRADTTRHLGVFEHGTCIACATFLRSEWETAPAWQLRGMAVMVEHRGEGLGRALLDFAERHLTGPLGVSIFWCNARRHAAGFYEEAGWSIVSEQFEIPGVGPHFRMLKQV